MRKILQNNAKTKKYLESLPVAYVICQWAGYGYLSVPYTKKKKYYSYELKCELPYVYQYEDHNGTCDTYVLRKIEQLTAGSILTVVYDETVAKKICEAFNKLKFIEDRQ